MDATFNTLAKIAALRSQVESYLVSTLNEIHKDKPDLGHAFDMGDKALAALETLRIVQSGLDRKVIAIFGELRSANTSGRA